MFQRIALSIAAAALLAAGPALAQAPAAPAAPPAAQLAPPPVAPPPEAKVEKHAKHEKARGHGTPQTHHCVKDGKLMADLTNKKCTAAGGTWRRDATAPAPVVKAAPKAEAPKP